MKLTVLFIICVFTLSAQTKIDFRDGKSITLNGKSLGTNVIYDYFEPSKISKYATSYYKVEGDTIEIAVYSEWKSGSMDDLSIYRIHKNQLDTEYFGIEKNTEENGKIRYDLRFSSIDGQKFAYKIYSKYSAIGEPNEFGIFTIAYNQKEELDELFSLIKN